MYDPLYPLTVIKTFNVVAKTQDALNEIEEEFDETCYICKKVKEDRNDED